MDDNTSFSLPAQGSAVLEHLRLLLLNVGYARHISDWNWQGVNSPFHRIYYVTEGSARVHLPKGKLVLEPGHLYFIPAFTTHDCFCNEVFSHFYIHAYEENYPINSVLENFNLPNEVESLPHDEALFKRLLYLNPSMGVPQSNPESYDNNQTLMASVHKNKQRSLGIRLESRGIMYQILARFIYRASLKKFSTDSRIHKAVVHIMKHLTDEIDLGALAEEACLSPDYFSRLFHSEMGEPPSKFAMRKRIELARLHLITERLPIKTIAYDLGFDDFSYFNRIFKKYVGVTPNTYRKQSTT